MRYFSAKGEAKAKVSPNLTAVFEHFNRVSHVQQVSHSCVPNMYQLFLLHLDVTVLHVEPA